MSTRRLRQQMLSMALLSNLLASPALWALEITQLRLNSNHIFPDKGEALEVGFMLSEAATPTLRIYDGRDWLVREIIGEATAGEQVLSWDGTSLLGESVPAEAYQFTISAVDPDGNTVVYDLSNASAGSDLKPTDVRWDAAQGVIEYRLSEPARVNVRVGLQNFGPLMKTVIDWVPRPAGLNTEAWDGMDQSSVLDLRNHPSLQVEVDAFSLARNTIFVGEPPDRVQLIDGLSGANKRGANSADLQPKRMHFHSQQPIETRGDVEISLAFLGDHPVDEDDIPILSGLVSIQMDVPGPDRDRVLARRFEPVFYVDGAFTFENEVGFLPFTWIWDTAKANDGIHYVTANLRGYEGNFGMATLKVRVNNAEEQNR